MNNRLIKKRVSKMLAVMLLLTNIGTNTGARALNNEASNQTNESSQIQVTTGSAYDIEDTTTPSSLATISITTGSAYYIDSQNGNDTNDGITPDSPWKSLNKINEQALVPGDQVLLKRGSIFDDQQLYPKGSGSEEYPVIIGAYGEGDQPIINANGKYRAGILIENMEHCIVENLEVTNDDDFTKNNVGTNIRRLGIHITIDETSDTVKKGQKEYKDISVRNCYVHHVDGDEQRGVNKVNGGIGVEVFFHPNNNVYPYFNGVVIDQNTVKNVGRTGIKGVRLSGLHAPMQGEDLPVSGSERSIRSDGVRKHGQGALNFVVTNNVLEEIDGDGILIDSTIDAKIEHNVVYNHSIRSTLANAGVWSWNSIGATFRYNEVYGGPIWNQDGCSYDADFLCAGTVFEYNYSHDTPMGFMLLMGSNETDVVRYNISQNDGMAWRDFCWQPDTTAYIYNNIFYYDAAKWYWSDRTPIHPKHEIYNNIFYNYNDQVSTKWNSKTGAKTNWDVVKASNNIVYEASGISGENEIPNAIHIDPQFILPGGGKTKDWSSLESYQLKETSSAINKGIPVIIDTSLNNDMARKSYNITEDFYGNPLYVGMPDIGVYEHPEEVLTDPIALEGNGVYSMFHVKSNKYFGFNQGNISFDEKYENKQEFTLFTTSDGYKIRMHDQETNKVYYLTAEETGQVYLEEESLDESQRWYIEDLRNGLVQLIPVMNTTKALTYQDQKLVLENKSTVLEQQWFLKLKEKSKSINVGGEDVEGYSKDRLFDPLTEDLGRYTDNDSIKVSDQFQGEEAVYNTAVEGEEIGYRINVPAGLYKIKLSFIEPKFNNGERVFDIIVNGSLYKEKYDISSILNKKGTEEMSVVSDEKGYIDVRLKAAYGQNGQKNPCILSGIAIEKMQVLQVDTLINCGSTTAVDGLKGDVEFVENKSGYYGVSRTVSVGGASDAADAGLNTVVQSGRQGANFGYKFNLLPMQYRVKMAFHDTAQSVVGGRVFDIYINDILVEENFDIVKEAVVANGVVILNKIVEPKNGLVDIRFEGKNGSEALVNGIIIEPMNMENTRTNIALNKPVKAQHEANAIKKGAKLAVDGEPATRWATGQSGKNGSWIQIDLEDNYLIDTVLLDWVLGACATNYRIQISNDGATWEDVKVIKQATPGLNIVRFEPVEGRYLRVLGETTNSEWGMSLCELEVYGVKSNGALDTSVTINKLEDSNIQEIGIGIVNTYKRYNTVKVEVDYNPEDVTFIQENLAVNPLVVYRSKNQSSGKIEYMFEIISMDAFKDMSEFMKIQVLPKGIGQGKVDVTVSLTTPTGHVTQIPTKEVYFIYEVTKEMVNQLILDINTFVSQVTIGDKIGMYSEETVNTFNEYVKEAKVKCEAVDLTDEQLTILYEELLSEFEKFKTNTIKPQYETYYKDYSGDYTKPRYEGQGMTIGDIKEAALEITLSENANIRNIDSVDLKDSTFKIKFSLDNVEDQTRFKVRENKVNKIEVTIDKDASGNTLWAWGGAVGESTKWGYFENAHKVSLEPQRIYELKITTQTIDNKTQLSVWLDDILVGSVIKAFDQLPGQFGMATRNKAKSLKVYEIAYTNAPEYTITTEIGENGSVKNSGTMVQSNSITAYGETDKTLSFIPNEGYEVDKVLVDNQMVNSKNTYTFEEIKNNHLLQVYFKPIEEVVGSYTVYYQDEQGIDLVQPKWVTDIALGVYEEEAIEVEGYTLVGESKQEVNLSQELVNKEIYFTYRKQEKEETTIQEVIAQNGKIQIVFENVPQTLELSQIKTFIQINNKKERPLHIIDLTYDKNVNIATLTFKPIHKVGYTQNITLSVVYEGSKVLSNTFIVQANQSQDVDHIDSDKPNDQEPIQENLNKEAIIKAIRESIMQLENLLTNRNTKLSHIPENHWAYESIKFMADRGILNTEEQAAFNLGDNVTRAEMALYLGRLLGLSQFSTSMNDIDVNNDAEYISYLESLKELEIMNGVSEEEFAPENILTREQAASILVRMYEVIKGVEIKIPNTEIQFLDEDMSDWAKEDIKKGQYIGLVKGVAEDRFMPKQEVTKPQLMIMLKRVIDIISND